MKRAYSMEAWRKDFAAAFAASVPVQAVNTQARGQLLAADNDEPEPSESFCRQSDSAYMADKDSGALQRRSDARALEMERRVRDAAEWVRGNT